MRKFAMMSALFLAACSSDSGTGSANNDGSAWQFDTGAGDVATSATDGGPNNGAQTNNGEPGNNGQTTGNNGQTTGNNGSSNNQTNGNNGFVDVGVADDVGTGTLDAGSSCTVNSDCGANLFCCQGFDGQATCADSCLSGGLCGGNDAECGRGEECCDLSGINLPDTCMDRCRGGGGGGGGNMGTPCTTNPDCTGADEVCCLGFDGTGTCQPSADCFTGGACAQDADCQNQQLCCDFNVAKVCLDRCNF